MSFGRYTCGVQAHIVSDGGSWPAEWRRLSLTGAVTEDVIVYVGQCRVAIVQTREDVVTGLTV